jgi:sugar-specific transcriptional regulator TrmB
MADDSEFITKLISFGLSEKEAQLYLHLLKYGPKPPSMLAKSLKTYREDVYRTLTSLIDKGMVNSSLETPTVYAAVDLDIALDTALKKHETELREMEMRKQEIQELSKQQRFRPSDEFTTYKIIKSLKEDLAIAVSLLNSLKEEFLVVVPEIIFVIASLYGVNEAIKKFIDRGGKMRVISDISYPMIELVQQVLDFSEDIRHYDKYKGVIFAVFDRNTSISAINVNIRSVSLNETISALMTDDPAYANYLVSTFELLWEQAIPATQRIEELLKEGPP